MEDLVPVNVVPTSAECLASDLFTPGETLREPQIFSSSSQIHLDEGRDNLLQCAKLGESSKWPLKIKPTLKGDFDFGFLVRRVVHNIELNRNRLCLAA
jgi:hypothetical protein